MSWIYLRYLQRRQETNFRGDPSDEFAFASFFPDFLRPVISPISSIFHRMFCGRSEAFNEDQGYGLGGIPLPGSDSIKASLQRLKSKSGGALNVLSNVNLQSFFENQWNGLIEIIERSNKNCCNRKTLIKDQGGCGSVSATHLWCSELQSIHLEWGNSGRL